MIGMLRKIRNVHLFSVLMLQKKKFFFCPVPRCLANLSVDSLGSRDRNIPVPFKPPVPSLTVSKRLDY